MPDDSAFDTTSSLPNDNQEDGRFWHLHILKFQKGTSVISRSASPEALGELLVERVPLLDAIKRTLNGTRDGAGNLKSLSQSIGYIKMLFRFAEKDGRSITLDSVAEIFSAWTESLIARTKLRRDGKASAGRDNGALSRSAALIYSHAISKILTASLRRETPLICETSLAADHSGFEKKLGDLAVLLYKKGASILPQSRHVQAGLGELGEVQLERVELLRAISDTLNSKSIRRGKKGARANNIRFLKAMFRYAELENKQLTLDSAMDVFIDWANHLYQRTELPTDPNSQWSRDEGSLTNEAAYMYARSVANILTKALGRKESLLALTPVRHPKTIKAAAAEALRIAHDAANSKDSSQEEKLENLHQAAIRLTFPEAVYGAEQTPWDANIFLYQGGASANIRTVQEAILSGKLGPILVSRIPLVLALYEELNARLTGGKSQETLKNTFQKLREFFSFIEREGLEVTKENVTDLFCAWADSLNHRTKNKTAIKNERTTSGYGPLVEMSAYANASMVGVLLNTVLERQTNILELTNLRAPNQRKSAIGIKAEKQSLSDTSGFGHLLQDLCDALTIDAVLAAPLPLVVPVRSGGHVSIDQSNQTMESMVELGKRYILANLRIQAELCMFIAQTGMNLAQAKHIQLRHFFYTGHIDGYQVKDYKNRRNGTVLFEIYQEYKPHFERYLEWRRRFFPHSNSVFPIIKRFGVLPSSRFQPDVLRNACKQVGIKFISPQSLRGTRVNWLLRKTGDPDLTAELDQHAKRTLLDRYDTPSLQRALVEQIQFWRKSDPNLAQAAAAAPGACEGSGPEKIQNAPDGATAPDCFRPSGCLWCVNHKDVDSFDYVWALVTFKRLKVIELARTLPLSDGNVAVPPAKLAIDRIDEKLRALEESNELRRGWVAEAQERMEEEDFHSAFADEITEMENKV